MSIQRYILSGKPHPPHRPIASGGGISLDKLGQRDRWRCHVCGGSVSREDASRDHIVPRSMGGTSAASNLALAHRTCNSARGTAPTNTRVTPRGWRKKKDPILKRKRRA